MNGRQECKSLVRVFIADYKQRHAHPINAVLHLVGVPMVLVSLYLVFQKAYLTALVLIALGYLLQYLGHRAQGNEVGEVTLIKRIFNKVTEGRHER